MQTYWTVGPYDTVTVLDEPDDESAAAFLLQVRSLEAVRATTLCVYNRKEMSGSSRGLDLPQGLGTDLKIPNYPSFGSMPC